MKIQRLLWFILAILVFCCGKDKNPMDSNGTPDNSYFPLAVGNEWTFKMNNSTTYKYKVIDKKHVNDKEYFVFDKPMPFFPNLELEQKTDEYLLRKDENGDVLIVYDNSEWLLLAFDDTLVNSVIKSYVGELEYWIYISSNTDTIQTDLGSFYNCFRILGHFPQIKSTTYQTWFAPGYGLVKIYEGSRNYVYELVAAKID